MPTRDTAWPAGTPCWVDYGAADLGAAKEFYADLFGWECTGGEAEFGGYVSAEKDGRAVAGLGPLMGEDEPGWTTYFATDDAAGTAGRIREAGGTVVVGPMEIGPMGTMVIARDPQGHPFGLWQSGTHTGAQRYNEPGSLVWTEAAVDDAEAARQFYTAVFGFRWEPVEGAPGYTTFATGGDPLGGLGGTGSGGPRGWTCCFAVASTDGTLARVEAAGGAVTMAATDTPYGRFAMVTDPWGAAFSVMELPAA